MKKWIKTILITASLIVTGALCGHLSLADNTNDVFMDEGDPSFEPTPSVVGNDSAGTDTPAKAGKKSKPTKLPPVAREEAPQNWNDDELTKPASKGDAYDQVVSDDGVAKKAPESKKAKKKQAKPAPATVEPEATQEAAADAAQDSFSSPASARASAPATKVAGLDNGSHGLKIKKQGFATTRVECDMHQDPDDQSASIIKVKDAKKIWVEREGDAWVKAYHKNGSGYLSIDCF